MILHFAEKSQKRGDVAVAATSAASVASAIADYKVMFSNATELQKEVMETLVKRANGIVKSLNQ